MASKGYAVLNVQNDDDELQFQDFGLSANSSSSHTLGDFPDSPVHQGDADKLLGGYPDEEGTTAKSDKDLSFWSFDFYKRFFDVDSKKVGDRIMWSMVPKPGVNYLQIHIRPKPDLYGPFWVCLTLVFAAAIAGNISNYLQTQGEQKPVWRYDFHKVSLAAAMVFSYGWLLPLILWGVLRYRSTKPPLTLLELTCLYGYSVSVLVPVCMVWTVPMAWLRWCVGIVAVVLSGVVLARSVWQGLKGDDAQLMEEDENQSSNGSLRKVAVVMLAVVVVMHVAIAMGFMFYFFSSPLQLSRGSSFVAPTAAPSANVFLKNNSPDSVPAPTKREVMPGTNTLRQLPEERIFNRSLDSSKKTPLDKSGVVNSGSNHAGEGSNGINDSRNYDEKNSIGKNSVDSSKDTKLNSDTSPGKLDTKQSSVDNSAPGSTDTKQSSGVLGSTDTKDSNSFGVDNIKASNSTNSDAVDSNNGTPGLASNYKIKVQQQ